MSHGLTDSDSFDAVVTPDVLDTTYPTTVTAGLQALANRTRRHENTLQNTGTVVSETDGSIFPIAGESSTLLIPELGRADSLRASITAIVSKIRGVRYLLKSYAWGAQQNFMNVPIEPVCEHDGSGGVSVPGTTWVPDIASNVISWIQQTTPVAQPILIWYIKGLPPTGTINQIACQIHPAGGHSALPGSMPTLELYRHVITDTPTATLVASATDSSATTGAYQAIHTINNSSFTESIAVNARYYLMFKGETGANALTSLHLIASQISITTN